MRPRPTLADYAVIAISPALIMAMVGSLVFFLIELFYQGPFAARLCYIMALFVMAAVLIGRISIEEGREHALLFAIPLGVSVALATLRFVQFQGPLSSLGPLFSLGLIALIWWSADKLTWDCTVIDQQQDASGEGLLQTVGMDDGGEGTTQRVPSEEVEATTSGQPSPPQGLWQKFVAYRRRPHAPGVWVLYFSLAALPIFGFGQWFAAQDLASRRYVFQLLVVYLAAGLGLLVTTSFLGLRRYLRQRRLEMPVEMAGSWLGGGAVLIVVVLLVCLMLPRRNPEYSVSHLPVFAGSPGLSPSEMGFGGDGVQDDEPAERSVHDPQGGTQSDRAGEKGQPTSDAGPASSQRQAQQPQSPRSASHEASDDAGQQDDPAQPASDRNQAASSPGERETGEPRDGEPPEDPAGDPQAGQPPRDDRKQATPPGETRPQDSQRERADSGSRSGSQRRFRPDRALSQLGQGIGGLLKLLYWLVVIVVVGYLAWRYWPQLVQAVRDFVQAIRDFWQRLWGAADEREAAEPPPAPAEPAGRRFADYSDPFVSGMAERCSPQQLIVYSFEAFEAWADERGLPREPEQTPHEFAHMVVRRERSLFRDAPRLAELYCWTAYGRDALPQATLDHLRRFWHRISETQAS